MLFELALADGVLHPSEDDLLKKFHEFLVLMKRFTSLYMKNLLIKQMITSKL